MNFPNLSEGLCTEVGVEIFYPEGPGEAESIYRMSRRICGNCPVKQACLEWAVRHESHGMWGGTTPRERMAIRKKLGITVQEVLMVDYV